MTFVNDYSQMTWLFLMKNCFEILSTLQVFRNLIKTQCNQKIRIL